MVFRACGTRRSKCQRVTERRWFFNTLLGFAPAILAQPTAFTYQGRLADNGAPANGNYDLRFTLHDAEAAGGPVGTPIAVALVAVSNSLFTVTLDFGASVFNGSARWLEIAVRTNGSVAAYSTLAPRQPINSTPYAIQALNAASAASATMVTGPIADTLLSANIPRLTSNLVFSGAVTFNHPASSFQGSFSGNGAALTNVDLRTAYSAGALSWMTTNFAASFSATTTVGVGSVPHFVTTADVNRDGRLDLISANYSGNNLSVLTNDGRGGFALAATYAVGALPNGVAAADVNRDGWVDLISANSGAGTLAVLTNNGRGGFALAATLTVGNSPRAVVAADVNGDGWADLISANTADGTLTVLTNNSAGGFRLASTPTVGIQPYAVTAADVNSDGRVDLISANFMGNTLTVLTNNGSGGFVLAASPAVGTRPYSVVAVDVNGDGKLDLISANAVDGTLTVLTNNGSGGFASAATLTVGRTPISVTAADVNRDGWVDLISANYGDNALLVLTNNRLGGFVAASTNSVGSGPWSVAAADVNRDGQVDLIAANGADNTLSVLLNTQPPPVAAFIGNGASLTALNASALSTGTLADARLNPSPTFGGTVTAAGFTGSGAGLSNLNLAGGGGWVITGNSGTTPGTHFLGTKDNKPMELRANDLRALSLTYRKVSTFGTPVYTEAVNLVGGYWSNAIASGVMGATIAGGGATGYATNKSGQGALFELANRVMDDYGTVSGGASNTAYYGASVSGGLRNTALGNQSTVPGGADNTASGSHSFAAGRHALARHNGAFVWADYQDADFASTGVNQFLIRAAGGVGINTTNPTGMFTLRGAQAGDWSSPLSFIENSNPSGNSGPALRLLSTGNSPDGVLNVGTTGTGKILALGAGPGEVANVNASGLLTLKAGVIVDAAGANSNALSSGIQFGQASGEGISSRRNPAGANQWGLDFSTAFIPRLSIANNGNVGIGTTTPQGRLDIDTGNGRVVFLDDTVPALNVVGNAANPGTLRLRNALEVWPSQDRSREGRLDVRDSAGTANITLNGSGLATVKVLEVTGGSDVAEPFPMKEDRVEPGSVVVIDEEHPGRLKLSRQAYDTRVAGIVSGANGVRPGLSLRQAGVLDRGENVALTGRVYVKADAAYGAIRPGDLLTTSATPGHAMRVHDHTRSQGAILGKAMSSLGEGTGHVLVLVTLQ